MLISNGIVSQIIQAHHRTLTESSAKRLQVDVLNLFGTPDRTRTYINWLRRPVAAPSAEAMIWWNVLESNQVCRKAAGLQPAAVASAAHVPLNLGGDGWIRTNVLFRDLFYRQAVSATHPRLR